MYRVQFGEFVCGYLGRVNGLYTGCKESQFYSFPIGQAVASMY